MYDFQDAFCGFIAFIAQDFELGYAHPDERKFCGDEEAVHQNQQDTENKFEHEKS